jgi:MscS family membrane protein
MDSIKNLIFQSLGIIIEEGAIFVAILTLNFLIRFFVRKIYGQIQHVKGKMVHDSFIHRIAKPLRMMLWLVGLAYMIYVFIVRLEMENGFTVSFIQLRNLIILFCSAWLCFEIKKQVQLSFIKRFETNNKELDKARIDLLSKLSSSIIVVLTALIALETIGVNIATLIAFGGVGGLAIGFASKDIVANYFSGFMIHITRPFKLGDWIYTPDQTLDGVVERIGYYLTVIRGLDKRPYYVPNALFSSKMIVNASRMTHRRIMHTLGLRYQDFDVIEDVVKDIKTMLLNHPDIDTKQPLLIDFNEYGPSSLNILVYAFTKTTIWKHWLDVQQDILLEIGKIIQKHGAEFAYPTTTINMPDPLLNQVVTPTGA